MILRVWFIIKYLFLRKDFLQLNFLLSIFGVSIGVASLFIAMAVFSGYETTLKKSIFDREGHIALFESFRTERGVGESLSFFKSFISDLEGITPFSYSEALILHKKKLSGILLQGLSFESVHHVLNLKKKIIKGRFELERKNVSESNQEEHQQPKKKIFKALIGKQIAKKNGLDIGDVFKIILSKKKGKDNSYRILPRYVELKVQGIMDFGRFDYNERSVVVSHSFLYQFLDKTHLTTGFYIKIKDPDQAPQVVEKINEELSPFYWARDWMESEKTLFEVIQLEKTVIFLVLCLMVLASGFNVSNTLFVSVMERSRDISLFKTLGGRNRLILSAFSLQGLMIGLLGVLMGMGLGFLIGEGFIYAQDQWSILSHVYKLERIDLEFRWIDFFWITFVSLLICFFATFLPAYKGIKFLPSEGLRYE